MLWVNLKKLMLDEKYYCLKKQLPLYSKGRKGIEKP